MEAPTLNAEERSVTGKKVKQLRRKRLTPIHLYGKGVASQGLQVDTPVLQRLLVQVGRTAPVNIQVNQKKHFAFVREIQRHPITGQLLHVDFLQVPLTERMRGQVPIRLTGEAPAIRLHNGVLMQALHTLEVECLPTDMPPFIEVDVSGLDELEMTVHVSDIDMGSTVTVITDPAELVARVQPPRKEEEVEEAVAEEVEVLAEKAEAGEEAVEKEQEKE